MKTIGIIARQDKPGIRESFAQTCNFLQQQELAVLIDQETADVMTARDTTTLDVCTMAQQADLVIVIGGDGSLLHAAHDVVASGTPMVGINRGRLGFLADISPEDIEKDLTAILHGDYHIEKRFLLESSFGEQTHRALNEIAISTDKNNSMIAFDVHINNRLLMHDKSDGLIIATPTGSTAYALSGGGPILHPELNSLVLVPMFSHTLSSRPIVIDADHTITLTLTDNNATVNVDGKCQHCLKPGDTLTLQKHHQPLKLVHPQGYDYFDTLRTKLHWGKHSH